jgi:hypothetical protein
MEKGQREEADRRFEEAREQAGARDPRDFYRTALRELKTVAPESYEKAVAYFQDTLVPSIASGEAEPLHAWREYGRLIAELSTDGQTVALDETGRSEPFDPNTPLDRLVLHLPSGKGRALLVSLPPTLSSAQRASLDLLVSGKHRLSAP